MPPYPEGYFNPYKNHDYVSGHFLPKWDKDKKSEYIEINERQFTKTRSTKITSSYFTSEVLELAEIFEFECLIWTSFEVLLENFTTIGKPTQTVETPLGPKEIYDPVQDKDVRAAFKLGYDQNDPMFQPRYTSDPKYSPQVYILKRAMFEQVNAYEDLSCSRVETSDCNVSFVYDCKRNQSCKYTAISTGPGMQVCGVGNQRAYNISAFRIGKHSHDNWPHLTQEEQLKNLFLVNCKSYAE